MSYLSERWKCPSADGSLPLYAFHRRHTSSIGLGFFHRSQVQNAHLLQIPNPKSLHKAICSSDGNDLLRMEVPVSMHSIAAIPTPSVENCSIAGNVKIYTQ